MKFIFIIMIALSSSITVMAQDTTKVFIDNKKIAEAIINADDTETLLKIKKSYLKKMKSIFIQVEGVHINMQAYKRSLEITDAGNSFSATETKGNPGHFSLPGSQIKKMLTTGKPVTLHLVLNPSNPMMSIPTRFVFIGKLIMK